MSALGRARSLTSGAPFVCAGVAVILVASGCSADNSAVPAPSVSAPSATPSTSPLNDAQNCRAGGSIGGSSSQWNNCLQVFGQQLRVNTVQSLATNTVGGGNRPAYSGCTAKAHIWNNRGLNLNSPVKTCAAWASSGWRHVFIFNKTFPEGYVYSTWIFNKGTAAAASVFVHSALNASSTPAPS